MTRASLHFFLRDSLVWVPLFLCDRLCECGKIDDGHTIPDGKVRPSIFFSLIILFGRIAYFLTESTGAAAESAGAAAESTGATESAGASIAAESTAAESALAAALSEEEQENIAALTRTAAIKNNFFIFFLCLNNKTIFSFKNVTKVILNCDIPNKNLIFFYWYSDFVEKSLKNVVNQGLF